MVTKQILLVATLLGLFARTSAAGAPVDNALREELVKVEMASWEMAKKQDVKGMRAFYPDDLVMILADGTRLSKAKLLATTPELKVYSYAIHGKVDVLMLTPDAVTLIYRIKVVSTPLGKKKTKSTLQSSSTYVRRAGKWRNVFYQETKLK